MSLPLPTILLVDDDDDDVLLVRRALGSAGWCGPIQRVADGQELLEYLLGKGAWAGSPLPGLILLDLNMPRLDGRSALARLRAIPDLALLPVIVLSTSGSPRDRSEAIELGANDFIQKPSTFADLVAAMRTTREVWLP